MSEKKNDKFNCNRKNVQVLDTLWINQQFFRWIALQNPTQQFFLIVLHCCPTESNWILEWSKNKPKNSNRVILLFVLILFDLFFFWTKWTLPSWPKATAIAAAISQLPTTHALGRVRRWKGANETFTALDIKTNVESQNGNTTKRSKKNFCSI